MAWFVRGVVTIGRSTNETDTTDYAVYFGTDATTELVLIGTISKAASYIYIYIYMYTHVYIYIYIYILCMYVCMYVCVYIYIYIYNIITTTDICCLTNMCVYIYIYIYTHTLFT